MTQTSPNFNRVAPSLTSTKFSPCSQFSCAHRVFKATNPVGTPGLKIGSEQGTSLPTSQPPNLPTSQPPNLPPHPRPSPIPTLPPPPPLEFSERLDLTRVRRSSGSPTPLRWTPAGAACPASSAWRSQGGGCREEREEEGWKGGRPNPCLKDDKMMVRV